VHRTSGPPSPDGPRQPRPSRADILWRNDDGSLSTWNADAAGAGEPSFDENSFFHNPVDRSWHVDGVGDFGGNGRDDILWRNDDGAVSVWPGSDSGFEESRFNSSAAVSWQIAQVGDFNADGFAEVLWRQNDGAISIWHSTGLAFQRNTYYDGSVSSAWAVTGHEFLL
jgi:hypothetical protein